MNLSNLPNIRSLLSSLPPWFSTSSRYPSITKDNVPLHYLEKACQILAGVCNRLICSFHPFPSSQPS